MSKQVPPRASPHASCCAFAILFLLGSLPAPLQAQLDFGEPIADRGDVRSGTPLAHRFTFVNRGAGIVEITGARASCGCLKPRLETHTCQPNESGSLLLEVNTLSQAPGPHEWKAWITYKAGDTSYEALVELRAHILAEITVRPAAMTIFAGSSVEHEILLTDLRSKPLSIKEVRPTSPYLKSQVVGEYQDESGHQIRKLKVQVASDYPAGRHEEVVSIYTDDPAYPELKVPITILKEGRQRLSPTPAEVTIQASRGQSASSKVVLVRDSLNQQVVIENTTSDDPAITCRWAKGPGNLATVKIQVDHRKQTTATLDSAVHIQVREPMTETLTIGVTSTLR
jgi:Protein of unknown function (DUF1573)